MSDTTPWYQKTEMIVALSAVIVSVAAVLVSVYSAWIDRSFARASTWPRLEIGRSFDGQSLSFTVSNQGTGPAVIRYAVLEHNQTRYTTWAKWANAEFDVPSFNFMQSHISTRVLSPGKELNVFITQDNALALAIAKSDPTHLTLCYCSVFDQCWLTDSTNQPKPIADCDTTPETPFAQ
ncbi:MAG: hypothetical protein AAF465_17365 [Pseudomonadota bacterium]